MKWSIILLMLSACGKQAVKTEDITSPAPSAPTLTAWYVGSWHPATGTVNDFCNPDGTICGVSPWDSNCSNSDPNHLSYTNSDSSNIAGMGFDIDSNETVSGTAVGWSYLFDGSSIHLSSGYSWGLYQVNNTTAVVRYTSLCNMKMTK